MNSGKIQFLAGALAAFLMMLMALDGEALLAAANRTMTIQQMPPEVRKAYDLEILSAKAFTVDEWKDEITSADFRLAVQKTLRLLNAPVAERLSLMVKAGILPRKANRAIVMRREAFETVFRALSYLWSEGMLPPPTTTQSRYRFADFKPQRRFRLAMTYLFENKILQGYDDGRMHARRPLTNRDCIYLLSRFYIHVAGERHALTTSREAGLIRISTEDWLREPIRRIKEAGGFAFTRPENGSAGNLPMTLADAAGMVSGILSQNDRSARLSQIQEIVNEKATLKQTNRAQLARLAAVLVGAFVADSNIVDFPYIDVIPDSAEGMGLRRLSGVGVKMGYPSGRFGGDETVTRYEVFGTLDAIIRQILPGSASPASEKPAADDTTFEKPVGSPSSNPDFEHFVQVMKAKHAKIKQIIGTNVRRPGGRSE